MDDEAEEREYARVMERDEWLSRASLPELIAVRGEWLGTRDEDAMEAMIEYRRAHPHM